MIALFTLKDTTAEILCCLNPLENAKRDSIALRNQSLLNHWMEYVQVGFIVQKEPVHLNPAPQEPIQKKEVSVGGRTVGDGGQRMRTGRRRALGRRPIDDVTE